MEGHGKRREGVEDVGRGERGEDERMRKERVGNYSFGNVGGKQ